MALFIGPGPYDDVEEKGGKKDEGERNGGSSTTTPEDDDGPLPTPSPPSPDKLRRVWS